MMKKIEVRISPDGEVEIEAIGFTGDGCLKATQAVEEELGTVTDRRRKPEFFRKSADTQQRDTRAK
jgi:hypothetical protein